MLNPMRDKNEGPSREGGKGRHLCPRLVQKIAEGKTSYELSWKVKVIEKKELHYSVNRANYSSS